MRMRDYEKLLREWSAGYADGAAYIGGYAHVIEKQEARRLLKVGTPDFIRGWEDACVEHTRARREGRTPVGVPIRTSYLDEAAYRSALLAAPVS